MPDDHGRHLSSWHLTALVGISNHPISMARTDMLDPDDLHASGQVHVEERILWRGPDRRNNEVRMMKCPAHEGAIGSNTAARAWILRCIHIYKVSLASAHRVPIRSDHANIRPRPMLDAKDAPSQQGTSIRYKERGRSKHVHSVTVSSHACNDRRIDPMRPWNDRRVSRIGVVHHLPPSRVPLVEDVTRRRHGAARGDQCHDLHVCVCVCVCRVCCRTAMRTHDRTCFTHR